MTAHVLPHLAGKADSDRVDTRLSSETTRLELKIETAVERIQAIVWRAAFTIIGAVLASTITIGGLLLRLLLG
jgi:hypothetical protein